VKFKFNSICQNWLGNMSQLNLVYFLMSQKLCNLTQSITD